MTDAPSEGGGRSRSDAASRLAALLSDVDEGAVAAPRIPTPTETAPPEAPATVPPLGAVDAGPSAAPAEPDLDALDDRLRHLPPTEVRPDVAPIDDLPTVRIDEPPPPPPVAPASLPTLEVPDGGDLASDPVAASAADPTPAADPDATQPLAALDLLVARIGETRPPGAGEASLATAPAAGPVPSASLETVGGADVDGGADGAEGGVGAADGPGDVDEAGAADGPGDGDAAGGGDAAPKVSDETVRAPGPVGVPVVVPDDPPRPVGLAPAPSEGPSPAPDELDDGAIGPSEQDGPTPRLRRVTPRSVVFSSLLVLLMVSVPALGYQGYQRVLDSRGGEVVSGSSDPTEAGYRAYVEPTPTALVVHRDEAGAPVSATLLSLGAGTTGGTVLQVPLETAVRQQRYYLDRLRTVYELSEDDALFFREVEDRLGLDIAERIDVDDESLAALVAPVAPLQIDNPDPVAAEDGTAFPAGPLSLAAEDVGPFLRATSEGETELGRLARNEVVWSAWLEAIGSAGAEDSVGAATTGIGPFLRVLAEGTQQAEPTTVVSTLDVEPPEGSDVADPPLQPAPGMEEQIIDAVPYPRTPKLGRRVVIELLNGDDGSELPMSLMHELVVAGASISKIGNADELGQDSTTIEIANEGWRDAAEDLRAVLGPDVEITTMSREQAQGQNVDVIVTLGSDVLDEQGSNGG